MPRHAQRPCGPGRRRGVFLRAEAAAGGFKLPARGETVRRRPPCAERPASKGFCAVKKPSFSENRGRLAAAEGREHKAAERPDGAGFGGPESAACRGLPTGRAAHRPPGLSSRADKRPPFRARPKAPRGWRGIYRLCAGCAPAGPVQAAGTAGGGDWRE